jgi:hypothetical protein
VASSASTGAAFDLVLGQPNFATATAGSTAAKLHRPRGLAWLSQRLAVADEANHRVAVYYFVDLATDGMPADFIFGTAGTAGTSTTQLNQPSAVAFQSYGTVVAPKMRLWVGDSGNRRVVRFDDLPPFLGAGFNNVADGVLGVANFTTTGSGAPSASTFTPTGLLISGTRLWVSDGPNFRVVRFEAASGKANGAAADGVVGQLGLNDTQRDFMQTPTQLAIVSGVLWIADPDEIRLFRYDTPTASAGVIAPQAVLRDQTSIDASATSISGWARDRATGKIFSLSKREGLIRRYASSEAFRSGAPPELTFGFLGTPLGLSAPESLALIGTDLLVADTQHHRVLVYANATTSTDPALPPSQVIGQPNFTSISPGMEDFWGDNRFHEPRGLSGYLKPGESDRFCAVADSLNHRVVLLRSDNTGGAWSHGFRMFGVRMNNPGSVPPTYSPVAGCSDAALNNPRATAMFNDRELWVADSNNHRVVRFRLRDVDDLADFALGQNDLSSSAAGNTSGKLFFPTGIVPMHFNQGKIEGLVIADTGNRRVVRYNRVLEANMFETNATLALGAADTTGTQPFAPPGPRAF